MFAGGNTPQGFFSFFDNILPPDKSKKTILLKGSSGSGKSTLMHRISKIFPDQDIEFFHCSNDPESLDGIVLKNAGISIIDGTSPHICDPLFPAVVDEIFNLGEFLDEDKVNPYRDELFELNSRKKLYYASFYNYLNAAASVMKNNVLIYKKSLSKPELYREATRIIHKLHPASGNVSGSHRRLFATAVTPSGLINFTSRVLSGNELYLLRDESGIASRILLDEIREAANKAGLDTEGFYCPLDPQKLEHLIIPAQKLAFSMVNKRHKNELPEDHLLDLTPSPITPAEKNELEYNDCIFDELLGKGIATTKTSLGLHERIEEIYSPAMDFSRMHLACEKIITRLKVVVNG